MIKPNTVIKFNHDNFDKLILELMDVRIALAAEKQKVERFKIASKAIIYNPQTPMLVWKA